MIWGYAGPWFGEFTDGDDSMMAKLKWLVANGLRTTHVFLPHVEAMSDEERGELGQYVVDHDLHLVPVVHFDFLTDDYDEIMRNTDKAMRAIGETRELVRAPIVTTLEPLAGFYEAEDYHQDFAAKNPNHPYVRRNALPKVEKVKKMVK